MLNGYDLAPMYCTRRGCKWHYLAGSPDGFVGKSLSINFTINIHFNMGSTYGFCILKFKAVLYASGTRTSICEKVWNGPPLPHKKLRSHRICIFHIIQITSFLLDFFWKSLKSDRTFSCLMHVDLMFCHLSKHKIHMHQAWECSVWF